MKLIDDDEQITLRFSCDCNYQGHVMDIAIEQNKQGELIQCSFNWYLEGKPDLKWRFKEALKALKGKDVDKGDFILRPEDYREIVNHLCRLVQSKNTSGTGLR